MCSDHGGTGSVFSGDKSFDEPAWGTFDANDDVDSVWGFNAVSTTKVSQYASTMYSVIFKQYFDLVSLLDDFCLSCLVIVVVW